jgi:hypothetical protein
MFNYHDSTQFGEDNIDYDLFKLLIKTEEEFATKVYSKLTLSHISIFTFNLQKMNLKLPIQVIIIDVVIMKC